MNNAENLATIFSVDTSGNLACTTDTWTPALGTITTSWWPNSWYYSPTFLSDDEKLGKAFRLAQVLISKKIVKIGEDAEKFKTLVNSIKEVL